MHGPEAAQASKLSSETDPCSEETVERDPGRGPRSQAFGMKLCPATIAQLSDDWPPNLTTTRVSATAVHRQAALIGMSGSSIMCPVVSVGGGP